ncbi:MAG: L-threonylcarbamoyladenylate synthase [Granulosicoccaceae bacterium]|jgi:tRNA threonylcarbamoyl adenosine modification protein (Sua5/YciO/YrdC/YwlC family)
MSQYFVIHPDNPQRRLIRQAVEVIRDGGLIAYPTDSSYALGCQIGDKTAMERLRAIRRVSKQHNFTLVCSDLSEIATYARVDNTSYRLLKQLTPGPYTFIFKATREVPRRLQHEKRKTIGIRVPDNAIALMLLEELGEPLMSSTLILPDAELPMTEPEEMREILGSQLDLIIDGGHCGFEPSTVIDLSGDLPRVVREGRGEVPNLE